MKIYKVSLSAKIFLFTFFAIMDILGIIYFIDIKTGSIFGRIITILAFLLSIMGIYGLIRMQIKIDAEKIEIIFPDIKALFLSREFENTKLSLAWSEIGKLDTHYVLYPENPIVVLRPKLGIPKKKIEFMMFGMPTELLADIIFHLPQETKISLYTYIKRKLEGKQIGFFMKQEWHETDSKHIKIIPHIYTKRQLIIIAVLLTLMVIAGFLFSLFFLAK